VSGLGGAPEYDQRFSGWAKDIDKALRAANARVETLDGPTREALRHALEQRARDATPQDALVLMLIGHGAFDGVDYKFNLRGPDITAAELARLLDAVPGRQLIVNMTSASGASIDVLSKPERVVITATKSGTEKNATMFARYWAEALRDPAADTDKNETISALEAFRYADRKTAKFYEDQKRLATEHPRLEGKLASSFTLVRYGQASAAFNDPARHDLLAKREQVERRIDELKLQKAALPEPQYRKELTALLIELARIQQELDR
jgi:hypothetical protein